MHLTCNGTIETQETSRQVDMRQIQRIDLDKAQTIIKDSVICSPKTTKLENNGLIKF